jgi:hypothetical protein
MTTQAPKRARFATEVPDTGAAVQSTTAKQPPHALAESFIRRFTASLHPDLAPITERLGKEHILLLSKLDNKKIQVQRMVDNADLIPRSARLNFKLSVSKRAEQRQEFETLQEETAALLETYKQGLKEQIIKATKIETTALEDELREHLVTACRIITKSYMILQQDDSDVDRKVYTLMELYLVSLSINCKMSLETFTEMYKTAHSLPTFPPDAERRTATMTGAVVPPDITALKEIIEGVFVTAWANYKQKQQQNAIALELKKFTTSLLTDKATATATMAIDTEPAADKPELQALIRYETKQDTKALRKEIEDLKKQVQVLTSAKNSNRRGRGGASSQEKTNTPPTPKTSKTKESSPTDNNNSAQSPTTTPQPAQAVGDTNGTGSGKRNKKTKNGKANSKKKKTGSNATSNTSSQTPRGKRK